MVFKCTIDEFYIHGESTEIGVRDGGWHGGPLITFTECGSKEHSSSVVLGLSEKNLYILGREINRLIKDLNIDESII